MPSKVELYRNLRTGTWSMREKGLVVGHPSIVELQDVKFVVRPGGRDKVRREGRKNVHAFVRGDQTGDLPSMQWREAYYNPYKHNTFVDVETGAPVLFAEFARLDSDMRVWYSGAYGGLVLE